MKKLLAITLAIVMLISLLPTSVLAFDQYAVYVGESGCQLTDLKFTQAENSWLLWDVTFSSECDGRVLATVKDHPNLIGRTVIPTFTYEGDSVTFNGETVKSGVTEVVLQEQNELIVYGDNTRAEYEIVITEETNGLPVVLIDTDGAPIPDKVDYVDTSISVLGAEIYGGDDIYAAVGGIKLRGNSTMGYDKKPYRIKFDKKQNVFGLGKAKSWVLLANYLDPAAIRNDIAYSFGSRLSAMTAESTGFEVYVPRMRPVEVYLNGEYLGLYDMGDHVQADETRIAIDESGDEFDDNDVQLYPEANVGYYLEIEDSERVIDEYESEGAAYFVIENTGGYSRNELYVQVKLPEVPSDKQLMYIENYLQTVNNLIRSQNDAVWDYIDLDGFVDWYLINEVFKNTDSHFLSSVKMFKDKDGKLFMGPVWDFDLGSGAVAYSNIDDPIGWRTREPERCDWYENLFEMDIFVEAVAERWADLHENGILDSIFTDIDDLSAYLSDAARDNYAMWHENYVSAVNASDWMAATYHALNASEWIEQVQYFKTYMKARIAWMDEQFGYAPTTTSTIAGEPVIWGLPEYGCTLTANTMAITPYGVSSLRYQWYADGAAISGATGSTFTPDLSYVGSEITVTVTGHYYYRGSVTSEPVVLRKTSYDYKTTQVPVLASKTHNSITITGRTNYDYLIVGEGIEADAWQSDVTFTDLKPNTLYRIYYRHAPTDERTGGQAGKPLYVITDADPHTPIGMLGDVNADGIVDMFDALGLYTCVSGVTTLPEDRKTVADLNGDSIIDMFDAMSLYSIVSGQA